MTVTAPLPPALGRVGTAARAGSRTVASSEGRLVSRQAGWFAGVVVAVGVADQATKAWAWRNQPLVHIDSGTGLLLGDRAGELYRDAVLGPALDVAALALVALLAGALLRRRRPAVPFLGAALVLGGWVSNLADRFALHVVTAPGSKRGVVDFLRWGGRLWNLADIVIIAGGTLCALSVPLLAVRYRPATRRRRSPVRRRCRPRRAALR